MHLCCCFSLYVQLRWMNQCFPSEEMYNYINYNSPASPTMFYIFFPVFHLLHTITIDLIEILTYNKLLFFTNPFLPPFEQFARNFSKDFVFRFSFSAIIYSYRSSIYSCMQQQQQYISSKQKKQKQTHTQMYFKCNNANYSSLNYIILSFQQPIPFSL